MFHYREQLLRRHRLNHTEKLLKIGRWQRKLTGLLNPVDFFFETLFYDINNPIGTEFFLPQLQMLKDADGTSNLLLDTLWAYINEGCSTTNTARVTRLHRNTIMRRLEKIEQITGLSLSNPENIHKVYFSLKMLQISAVNSAK